MTATSDIRRVLARFADARVLVIDDTESSVLLLQAILTGAGIRTVHSVMDSTQAMARIAELDPDLILLDLRMPRVDGYTILDELRRGPRPDVPVLVLTADTTREASRRALELGASDFVSKPIDNIEIILRIRNLLATQALQADLLTRQRWADATADVARALIENDASSATQLIADCARTAAGADIAAAHLNLAREPTATATFGIQLSEAILDRTASLLVEARAITSWAPPGWIRPMWSAPLDDVEAGSPPQAGETCLALPIATTHSGHGALLLTRTATRGPFSDSEAEAALQFCRNTAVALELAKARTADTSALARN